MSKLILQLCYPVGSYFINDNEAFNTVEKVRAYMGFGTWVKLEDGRFIESGSSIKNVAAGLPNIAGNLNVVTSYDNYSQDLGLRGAFTKGGDVGFKVSTYNGGMVSHYPLFNASNGECGTQEITGAFQSITYDNKVYGKSETVQPKSRTAYIYYRTA